MKPVQYDLYLAIVFYFGLDRPPEIIVCLRCIPFLGHDISDAI